MSDAEAVIILVDNSESSINGDFYPNRLDAEKIAAERLFQYIVRQSAKTQISVGTLATAQFGIQASLTIRQDKVSKAIAQIKRGGTAELEHGIRCAFLALRHRDPQISARRVIVFIGSHHTMTEESAEKLAADANREGVAVSIVAFGDDVNDIEVLENFVQKVQAHSEFVRANAGTVILSDIILSSPIGPGEGSAHTLLDPSLEEDPDVALAIRQSLDQANNDDDELQAAIRASMNDAMDDPGLREAIRQSLMDQGDEPENPAQPATPAPAEPTNEENPDEIDDPELQEALRMSMEQPEDAPEPPKEEAAAGGEENPDEIDDPELAEALRMSMEQPEDAPEPPKEEAAAGGEENPDEIDDPELAEAIRASIEVNQPNDEIQQTLDDPEALNDILSSLPGVDPEQFKKNKDDEKEEEKK
jgi:26S proteasome regulatory subunit N10